jgi:hypothetical protein
MPFGMHHLRSDLAEVGEGLVTEIAKHAQGAKFATGAGVSVPGCGRSWHLQMALTVTTPRVCQ